MNTAVANPYWQNFLGASPDWYKKTIIAFLIINPILLYVAGPFVTGWVLIGQFIFTLALALQCYPLQPCLLYTSPSPRDRTRSRMPSSA